MRKILFLFAGLCLFCRRYPRWTARTPNRIGALLCAMAFVLVPLTTHAQQEDEYPERIPWWGGEGEKTFAICNRTGYFVNGMQNFDHGNNNQSALMTCSRIDAHLPVGDTDHARCIQEEVVWFGGVGDKPWSHCPDGKYAVGFQLYDYGRNNQGIRYMRCCEMAGITTEHGNSHPETVMWHGGAGLQTPQAECREGYYVTGVYNKDWGNNNQSVGGLTCTQPVPVP